MAQYWTDFSEYTVSAQPSDWTLQLGTGTWQVETDAGAEGGKSLQRSGDSTRDFFVWDDIDADANRDDVEVVMLVSRSGVLDAHEIRSLMRGVEVPAGSPTTREGYIFGIRADSLLTSKFVNGAFSDITTSSGQGFVADTWYWVRTRVNGTTVQSKWWEDGDAEPGTWQHDTTDSDITAAGWVGLYSNRDSAVKCAVFGVGTNGDTAPTTDPGGAASIAGPLAGGAKLAGGSGLAGGRGGLVG